VPAEGLPAEDYKAFQPKEKKRGFFPSTFANGNLAVAMEGRVQNECGGKDPPFGWTIRMATMAELRIMEMDGIFADVNWHNN
jgi:hypothetical protein